MRLTKKNERRIEENKCKDLYNKNKESLSNFINSEEFQETYEKAKNLRSIIDIYRNYYNDGKKFDETDSAYRDADQWEKEHDLDNSVILPGPKGGTPYSNLLQLMYPQLFLLPMIEDTTSVSIKENNNKEHFEKNLYDPEKQVKMTTSNDGNDSSGKVVHDVRFFSTSKGSLVEETELRFV